MKETIEFIVKVKINYENKERRVEAINKAKSCLLNTSILGSTGVRPKSEWNVEVSKEKDLIKILNMEKQIINTRLRDVNNTTDCVNLLNTYVKKGKWKRLYKIGNLRCFSDGSTEVTVADNAEEECCLYVGINVEEEIKAILKVAKYYYTYDYGEIFYNPFDKSLHLVGSDCGWVYSKKKPSENEFSALVETGNPETDCYVSFNEHELTSFIVSEKWGDESMPDDDKYFLIGKVNLMDEYEGTDEDFIREYVELLKRL